MVIVSVGQKNGTDRFIESGVAPLQDNKYFHRRQDSQFYGFS